MGGKKESEYIASMLKVIFDDHEITTDGSGRIRPEDYLDWLRDNDQLIGHLERLLQNARKKSSRSRGNKSNSPEDQEEPNDMEGFLFKVGRTFGNWHERWFVLKGKFLYGFRTDRDKNYNDLIH